LWIKAYKPQVFVPMLIEMNTIQGVLATVRATGAATVLALRLQRGEFMRCETYCSYLAA